MGYIFIDVNEYNEMVFNNELMKNILEIYMEHTEINCINSPELTYEGQRRLNNLMYESNTNLKEKVKELLNEKKNTKEEENEAND